MQSQRELNQIHQSELRQSTHSADGEKVMSVAVYYRMLTRLGI